MASSSVPKAIRDKHYNIIIKFLFYKKLLEHYTDAILGRPYPIMPCSQRGPLHGPVKPVQGQPLLPSLHWPQLQGSPPVCIGPLTPDLFKSSGSPRPAPISPGHVPSRSQQVRERYTSYWKVFLIEIQTYPSPEQLSSDTSHRTLDPISFLPDPPPSPGHTRWQSYQFHRTLQWLQLSP